MEGLSRIESKEQVSPQPDLRVDFVRHGKPKYSEEELVSADLEGTLTDEGIKQVKRTAIDLIGRIDKEKELVVFWVSPNVEIKISWSRS